MKNIILILIALAIVFSSVGCATIFHPERCKTFPPGTTFTFDGGMFFLDIIFTGMLGIIIDLASGGLWIPHEPPPEK